MSAMTASNAFYTMENNSQTPPKPSSPASPTSQFTNQQSVASRSFINLNPDVRGQNPPFPATPTSSHQTTFLEPPPGSTYADFIRTWSDSHVARWLTDIKCGSHASLFRANDIRGDILLELDQVSLKEMGVASIGDRLRILNAVKVLRQRAASRAATPVSQRPTTHYGGDSQTESSVDRLDSAAQNMRPQNRRLEAGRPAPLQLNPNSNRGDLPGLIRETPDSARGNGSHPVRPLPQPNQSSSSIQSQISQVATPSSAHSVASLRPHLPPLPPPPAGRPPLPPPSRISGRNALNSSQGYTTPTQSEVPAYTTQGLPAPPQNGLLTPSSGKYHLPADPRPVNTGGTKTPIARSTSPLPPGRARNGGSSTHGRNGSVGVNSPNPATPSSKLPPRPSTTNSHPYANPQAALHPPTNHQIHNLSPIEESFAALHSASGTPSPPSIGYAVGRGPFNPQSHGATASTRNDLRRKLVKFVVPDENLSCTIDAGLCSNGFEIIEKVLKKIDNKGGSKTSDDFNEQSSDGAWLSVDGWTVYLGMGQEDGPGEPLTEAELLSVCHAPPDDPTREYALTMRRSRSRINRSPSPGHKSLSPQQSQTSKSAKRASSISILSGLGVHDPEKALEPPSPTSGRLSPAAQSAKRPSKLRNFFGQRPPSELITTHLTEYFPFTEKKVLERTARHSMMRSNTMSSNRRESVASFQQPLPSRFSSSTQGSHTRMSISPSRASFSSIAPPPVPDKRSPSPEFESPTEEIPRMSLSTEDGRSIDLHPDGPNVTSADPHPQLLPPIPFPTESFSESMEGITGQRARPTSRAMSISSRRMSYMTELRSKRDRSDTASLMTVDEITAEVESRTVGGSADVASSDDGWTNVDAESSAESMTTGTLVNEEVEEEEEDLEEEENTLDGEDEDFPKSVAPRIATKWIKGALIGAGSFGKVYLGMDASNGLLMAVKQVELPSGSGPNEERKKSMLSALEREIELLKNLQHENIVQYLYSSIDEEYLNIFLEYVPGGSVTALLRNYGAFEETLVKNFVRQILQGLDYLHERDIIHRDIKGANILVDNKGGIKISDFGISKKVDDNLLTGNRIHRPSLQGSVFWMAPEVVKQCGHTRKADIWSVGCLVVEMLTGEHPWAQLTQMQAIFKIGSSAKPTIPSDISADAQDFLQRTFELDHEARPSAAELLQHAWVSPKTTTTKGGSAKSNATTEASA
ncbi:hypothetical protein BDQ12DRAFT_281513 [Crucibulum laeve]|uniref:mitogen-activated protein kinase kinase kinase n=1 Tax=Crucibulum laeve TaxID=68775 RepID=A0A5C3MFB0_9AGAR|nr:hypothetical protein BDQ12DRAFT_281513 [Crucibulum laeve]